jgi:hypothetical protein
MVIYACPKCGSRRIFQGRLKDGVLTGYTSKEVCRDCGYRGSPIIFDSEIEYKKFLKGITSNKKQKSKSSKKEKLSKKDEEVLDYLDEIKEEINGTIDDSKKINGKNPKILKNSITTIGIVIMAVGILLTAVSFFWVIFTGSLILVGAILFITGLVAFEGDIISKTSKPTIAGILFMWSGILGIYLWSNITGWFKEGIGDPLYLSEFGLDIDPNFLLSILQFCSIIAIIFCIFSILGGIYAIKRKKWSAAVLGGILGFLTLGPIFSSTVFCFIGLILLFMSKKDFKN